MLTAFESDSTASSLFSCAIYEYEMVSALMQVSVETKCVGSVGVCVCVYVR